MDKPFTVKGYWFLPNQEEQKIAGILSYEPGENIRLELFGSLSGNSLHDFLEHIYWNESTIVPLIYGHTSDGKYYS